MKRTQIQIPDPLYKEVKRLAALKDWSVSEVFRRAVEQLVAQYPNIKQAGEWQLPEPRNLGQPLVPSERWRDLLGEEDRVVVAEQTLVEVYLLIRNPSVFPNPYPPVDVAAVCQAYRTNPRWKLVECEPVMEEVWKHATDPGFARRRIIEARFALTLLRAGFSMFSIFFSRITACVRIVLSFHL